MHAPATLAIAVLSLVSGASAIKVLYPDRNTIWSSGSSSQMIAWEAVSTDPTTFEVQLSNQQGFLSGSLVTLTESQSTGSANVQNTAQVTFPNGAWPVGTAFQINLVNTQPSPQGGKAILAQSNQFNITNSGSSGSGAASSATTPAAVAPVTLSTARPSSSSNTPLANVAAPSSSAAGNDALGGLPNAATSSRAAGELTAAPSTLVAAVVGVAAYFGVFA